MTGKSFGPDWQPDEPTILEKAEVIYSFDPVEGFTSYSYTATYGALTLHRRVYTDSQESFEALLAHWNRDEKWGYEL